ncbi:hypothetical protein [uncultured Roseobacter sp.]|uniref:hypothetical protein n=1 Tax=uncultured Roseobacter sp. TaxID=114847 RepID=UPI0026288E5D|nr:hypothetical protein [uncultured Roseobacter sp.]
MYHLFKFLTPIALYLSFATVAVAQSSFEERAQLLQAVEDWCSQPNVEGGKYENLVIEGGAGTSKILKGFGLSAEGDVSVEQVETLNFQLNGIKRSAEDCRAKSLSVLAEIFFGDNLGESLSSVTDRCQQTSTVLVCVKTSDIKVFGGNIRIPLTLEAVGGNAKIQFKEGGGTVFVDSGEEFAQSMGTGAIRLASGVPVTQVFSAKVPTDSDVSELALEVNLSNPVSTSLWFDEIFLE